MSPDPTPTARDRVVAALTTLEQLDATWPVRDLLGSDLRDRLVAVLATAGTEGEAEEDDEAARLQELNGVLRTINAIGPEAPASAVRDYVQARVSALEPAHPRPASSQGEAQGQGEDGDPA